MSKHKKNIKRSTKKSTNKRVTKHKNKRVTNHKGSPKHRKKMPTSKRYQLLMNCVAPHLLPQKSITYPLNSITRGTYLSLSEKLVYAELYSMFKMSPKFQYHAHELSQVISIHKNVANIITRTIHKLNHLGLITIDNVYDTKDSAKKKPIGFVIHNNGALNQSISYGLIQREAKAQHKQKSISHLQGDLASREARKIIIFFNKFTNRSFRPNNKSYIKAIASKLRNKYTVQDCKLVIIYKYEDWKDKPDMKKFIQPSTLFRPSNFDRYLTNAKIWKQSNPRLFDEDGNYIMSGNTDNDSDIDDENSGGGFRYDDDF